MATTKIRSSSIEDGQVSNADLSATIGVTGGQIADDAITTAKILDNNITIAKIAGSATAAQVPSCFKYVPAEAAAEPDILPILIVSVAILASTTSPVPSVLVLCLTLVVAI